MTDKDRARLFEKMEEALSKDESGEKLAILNQAIDNTIKENNWSKNFIEDKSAY